MMILEERLAKYKSYVDSNPRMRNQIIVKNGKGVMFVAGKKYQCEKVEGFIKFPGDQYVEDISTKDISICILPKKRLLVARNGEWYMGGYKKGNSSECFLVLRAVSDCDEIFIVWIAEEDIPICIMIGDCELEKESIGTMMMKVFQYVMFNDSFGKLEVSEGIYHLEGGEVDEFE